MGYSRHSQKLILAAGAPTYQMEGSDSPHNGPGFQDYYYLYCEGEFHAGIGVPLNHPFYDGLSMPLEHTR